MPVIRRGTRLSNSCMVLAIKELQLKTAHQTNIHSVFCLVIQISVKMEGEWATKIQSVILQGGHREKSVRLHWKGHAFEMSLEGRVRCWAFNNVQWVMVGQEVRSKQKVQHEIGVGTREQFSLAGQGVALEESWKENVGIQDCHHGNLDYQAKKTVFLVP